jgi:hypothetical protein
MAPPHSGGRSRALAVLGLGVCRAWGREFPRASEEHQYSHCWRSDAEVGAWDAVPSCFVIGLVSVSFPINGQSIGGVTAGGVVSTATSSRGRAYSHHLRCHKLPKDGDRDPECWNDPGRNRSGPPPVFSFQVVQYFEDGCHPVSPGAEHRVLDQPLPGCRIENRSAQMAFQYRELPPRLVSVGNAAG